MAEILTDEIDFSAYLRETDAAAKVRPARAWIGAMKDRLRSYRHERRTHLPWDKARDAFAFRDGETTVWGGQNGAGKSLVTAQVALSLMGQGERVCIASFEMKPAATLQRMARMFCGMNPFSPEFQGEAGVKALEDLFDDFGDWTDGRLWLYDQQGSADPSLVIGMARFCAKELGIKHVFVDNLAKCVRGEDDYNGQKAFVDDITALARDCAIHVHVVHHLRKPAREDSTPDKHDTKGSGSIVDQVDNLFLLWRNKPKEEDLRLNERLAKRRDEADAFLLCRKQRNYEGSGDGEPTFKLWFHRDAQQFVEAPHEDPQFFPNWPHRRTPT